MNFHAQKMFSPRCLGRCQRVRIHTDCLISKATVCPQLFAPGLSVFFDVSQTDTRRASEEAFLLLSLRKETVRLCPFFCVITYFYRDNAPSFNCNKQYLMYINRVPACKRHFVTLCAFVWNQRAAPPELIVWLPNKWIS